MGRVSRALSCYCAEAEEAAAQKQHLLALLYLRQALRLAHLRARDEVPGLLRRLAVQHAAVECPLRAWTLRQQAGALTPTVATATSGSSDPPPQLSRLHQTLEALRVRFHEMLMDYHLHLATHEKLTAEDENRTGEFFVSFLNLLDKVYSHWGHSALHEKGDGRRPHLYFPYAFSRAAWESDARESQIWGGTIKETQLHFRPLRLMDGLLEAEYIDSKKLKRWTAKAVAARPAFRGVITPLKSLTPCALFLAPLCRF